MQYPGYMNKTDIDQFRVEYNEWLDSLPSFNNTQTVIIHGISVEQIEVLEQQFAYLTADGWKIPQWVQDLKSNVH